MSGLESGSECRDLRQNLALSDRKVDPRLRGAVNRVTKSVLDSAPSWTDRCLDINYTEPISPGSNSQHKTCADTETLVKVPAIQIAKPRASVVNVCDAQS